MISHLAQRLSQELQNLLPAVTNLIPKRELHLALQSSLAKLNLVTREEFDAQAAVLHRTRQKLEALELRCAEMEQNLKQNS
ncbi:MAG: accessory factor UbiK family protein [Gammaproteobacteria bacterium]|nr:MAG: accessory factor UbiK family protein [Gammaproteobacteria bacterium]